MHRLTITGFCCLDATITERVSAMERDGARKVGDHVTCTPSVRGAQERGRLLSMFCVLCARDVAPAHGRLVRWDMRDPTGVVQESASPVVQYAGGKDYAGKVNFNCMATSGAPSCKTMFAWLGRSTVASMRCCGCRWLHGKRSMAACSRNVQMRLSSELRRGSVCGG